MQIIKGIETLTIKFNDLINLVLIINIDQEAGEKIFFNKQLNILAIYDSKISMEEARKKYAMLVWEWILENSKNKMLGKIFLAANIKLLYGSELKNQLSNQVFNYGEHSENRKPNLAKNLNVKSGLVISDQVLESDLTNKMKEIEHLDLQSILWNNIDI